MSEQTQDNASYLHDAFDSLSAYPFWEVQDVYEPKDPVVKEKAHVWRYEDFEPLLIEAAETVSHEIADRRGIILRNPAYDMSRPFTTNSQFSAYSIYRPGEVFTPHIHTPAASRMVLRSDGGGYTTVEGEKCYLERGDLILTPGGTWHDHGNEGKDLLIWVDMLDIPVPAFFNAYRFAFDYKEGGESKKMQTPHRSPLYSSRHYGFGGLRPRFAEFDVANGNGSPQMHFKYKDVRAALNAVRDEAGDPYDGIILDYVDVRNGGPIQKTQNFSMQLLRPGEQTLSHRHTSSAVYVVLEGEGSVIVNGEELKWQESDVFCVPSYHWHEFKNSEKGDAVLYSVSDSPSLKALGFYWEDRKTASGEIVTVGSTC